MGQTTYDHLIDLCQIMGVKQFNRLECKMKSKINIQKSVFQVRETGYNATRAKALQMKGKEPKDPFSDLTQEQKQIPPLAKMQTR